MILRQIALSLAALLAISPDAFGQDRPANGAVADNQLVFNNVCRTCHTLKEGDTPKSKAEMRRRNFQQQLWQASDQNRKASWQKKS
jgi:hypothetical protein